MMNKMWRSEFYSNVAYVMSCLHTSLTCMRTCECSVDNGFDENDIPYDVLWLDIEHTDEKR